MAKQLSRLISNQRAKTNAKHAQNAAYNASVRAGTAQPRAPRPPPRVPMSHRQRQDLQHMANRAVNAAQGGPPMVPPGPVAPGAPVPGATGAMPQMGIGQFEQNQIAGGGGGQGMQYSGQQYSGQMDPSLSQQYNLMPGARGPQYSQPRPPWAQQQQQQAAPTPQEQQQPYWVKG